MKLSELISILRLIIKIGSNKLKRNSPVVIQRPEANITILIGLFDRESVSAPINELK